MHIKFRWYGGLDQRIDDRIGLEIHQQAVDVVGRDHDAGQVGDRPAADNADRDAQDGQKGEENHRGDDLRQDQVRRGIDAHDLQRVDLFGDAHGADLRGDARPDLAGQNQRHDRR